MIRHIITSEYPPQPGGVSDYTRIVAEGLAAAGDEVHVWCPNLECGDLAPLSQRSLQLDCSHDAENQSGVEPPHSRVFVHREMSRFAPCDLRRTSRLLNQFPASRRVLVQWVPHGYGFRSMNLVFCLWLWLRSLRGDRVELMVHEPSLGFGEGTWKHNVVAFVHRLMTIVLLRATRRVWVSIPAWETRWRPYALGRAVEFHWLPVGSNIPTVGAPQQARKVRAHFVNDGCLLVGHFGSYDTNTSDLLLKSVPELLKEENTKLLLLGYGSEQMREALVAHDASIADRIHATGSLSVAELSPHISACDLMLQPYIDGVSSRRTSTMTALSHGVPVATTRGKFTESLWAESKAIALAPVEDVPQLIKETRRLLPEAAARNGIRTAARKFYIEHFDSARTIARLREDTV